MRWPFWLYYGILAAELKISQILGIVLVAFADENSL